MDEDYTEVSAPLAVGGADQEPPQEAATIGLGDASEPMAAYLCWLIAKDTAHWSRRRRAELQKHEALSFAKNLSSALPERRRALLPESVKKQPPRLKAG